MRQVTIAIVAVVLALAADAVAAADSAGQMGSAQVTLLPAATVYVTPDHFAQLPLYLIECTTANVCLSKMALYQTKGSPHDEPADSITIGARLSRRRSVAFFPDTRDTEFPAVRLLPAAWQKLTRDHVLATTLVASLPSDQRQILAYVILRPPLPGERVWCQPFTLDPQCANAVGHLG
jgi:hypothetical protein